MKRCYKCGEEKDESCFSVDRRSKHGLQADCKDCARAYRQNNKEAKKASDRAYYEANKERLKEKQKEYQAAHSQEKAEYDRRYLEKNRDRIRDRLRAWTQDNRKDITRKIKQRCETDSLFYLRTRIPTLIRQSLKTKGYKKASKTFQMLGCVYQDFLSYLGEKPCDDAHLDHICPCAQAKTENELIKLQHYTNFQWLSPEDNIRKSDKRTPEAEDMCRKLLGREWID